MSKIIPIFMKISFDFGSEEAPQHIDAYPFLPRFAGLVSISGMTSEGKPYPLALDIESTEVVGKLTEARIRQQEQSIGLFGYTDDVYINYPDGSNERVYIGRSIG